MYLIFILCLPPNGIAEANNIATFTKADAIKAIANFKQQPLTENGRVAAGKIIEFAEQSDDVTVHIAESLVPWLHDKTDEKYRALLLGAYVAGNVKSQLDRGDNGVKRDDPYAGMLVVIEVYQQIKGTDKKYDIPKIEEFIELEAQHKLKGHLERLLREEVQKPDAVSETQRLESQVSFFHAFSHFSFPTNVGSAIRVGVEKYDKEGLDVSAVYKLSTPPLKITVYVYPAPKNAAELPHKGIEDMTEALLNQHFEKVKSDVLQVHPGTEVLSQGVFQLTQDKSHSGRRAVFNYDESIAGVEKKMQSEAYLFLLEPDKMLLVDDRFYVLYRFTFPTATKESGKNETQTFLKSFLWPSK